MTDRQGERKTPEAGKHQGRSRLRLVFLAGAMFWALLVGRLVQVQAVQHHSYAEKAMQQHDRWVDIAASRGRIFDREGRVLAQDVPATSFYCHPSEVRQPQEVARHFAAKTGRKPEVILDALNGNGPFVYLARQVPDTQAAAYRPSGIEGIREQKGTCRYYPFGSVAGQLLGFADIDKRGREGVEISYDSALRETTGKRLTKVDSRGRQLSVHNREHLAPQDGSSLTLTIDAVYQDILEEELARAVDSTRSEGAYAIISRPHTGEILAMASVPLFNPNEPGKFPAEIRRNRAITDSFEPGSTFKAITAASVFEEELAIPKTLVYCENGSFRLTNGDNVRDVGKHGWLTASEVLVNSSNIGMMKMARRLQRPRFYEYLRNFGFGTRTALGLPAESGGLLRHARKWSDRSLETIAIGQEVSVTALQMVQAFGAIANGGQLMAPQILRVMDDGEGGRTVVKPKVIRRVISEKTSSTMREILAKVVRDGTGRMGKIPGVDVAGKTGTAQRAAKHGKGYARDEYIVSFVGFLPARQPEFLCLVVMLNPRTEKWGGRVAAPVFRRVMERVYFQGGIKRPRAPESRPSPALAARVSPVLPDLRGLSPETARYHGNIRGLAVHFAGEGTTVISQDPPPGSAVSDRVACTLGHPREALFPPTGMPVRQSVLLAKFARRPLAYSQ